jgi:outer membrane protein OmpA-like peptidoglycan-associated protein
VDSLKVDGVYEDYGIWGDTYTFRSVNSTHTIVVGFHITEYHPSGRVIAGEGTIEIPNTVEYGATPDCTYTPAAGYHVTSLTRNESPVTFNAAGGVYRLAAVTADPVDMEVAFAINTYTLSYGHGTGGSVEGSATQVITHGESGTEVTATPDPGYHFVSWSDGEMSAARTDADADLSVTAYFASNRPPAPYSVTWSPAKGGTLIQWAGSPGATGYQVWLGAAPSEPSALTRWNPGRLLGTTGPSTCSLFVPEYLGPGSAIYVVALGTPTSSLPGVGVYTASVTPVQMGTVRFTGNSSRLTPATKRALKRYASLMATQRFTSLKVSGYTAAHDHGSKAFRRRLSLKRAKNVKAYLASEFKRLHVRVSITTAGYGGTNPVASNRTASGMAKNRRAELILK